MRLSRATLNSACLPGWLNMRVTSGQHVPRVICMSRRQEMFLLSPRNFCMSLPAIFVARYKVSEVAKLGDTEGTSMPCHVAMFFMRALTVAWQFCCFTMRGEHLRIWWYVWRLWISFVGDKRRRNVHWMPECCITWIAWEAAHIPYRFAANQIVFSERCHHT